MFQIRIQTYNNQLLNFFLKQLKIHPKLKNLVQFTLLPSKRKIFTVKKSPHVFGRSKEKYFLKTYSVVIKFDSLRKKDILFILSVFEASRYKEGLGLKFSFWGY